MFKYMLYCTEIVRVNRYCKDKHILDYRYLCKHSIELVNINIYRILIVQLNIYYIVDVCV
jgi:hypothetical protein